MRDDINQLHWTPDDLSAPDGRLPDGRIIVERYARCPTCEQWSPCTVRERIMALLVPAKS
jgi:hypothetical protein